MKSQKIIAELNYHLDMATQEGCDQNKEVKSFLQQCQEIEQQILKLLKHEDKKPSRRKLKKELVNVQNLVSQFQQ
jgi:hypothetical protein